MTVDGSGTIHNPGAVFVEGKRIADLGPSDAVAARHPNAARVIEGRGKIVAPGFVNIHSHVGPRACMAAQPVAQFRQQGRLLRGQIGSFIGAS